MIRSSAARAVPPSFLCTLTVGSQASGSRRCRILWHLACPLFLHKLTFKNHKAVKTRQIRRVKTTFGPKHLINRNLTRRHNINLGNLSPTQLPAGINTTLYFHQGSKLQTNCQSVRLFHSFFPNPVHLILVNSPNHILWQEQWSMVIIIITSHYVPLSPRHRPEYQFEHCMH